MGTRRSLTRGDRVIRWIERYCVIPSGKPVQLAQAQRAVRLIYDHNTPQPVQGPLAAYLALLHTCGIEARSDFRPQVEVDIFTTWNAAGPELRRVLKREGEAVVCPALGTRFPCAA